MSDQRQVQSCLPALQVQTPLSISVAAAGGRAADTTLTSVVFAVGQQPLDDGAGPSRR